MKYQKKIMGMTKVYNYIYVTMRDGRLDKSNGATGLPKDNTKEGHVKSLAHYVSQTMVT
jgi:hypothetical protein